MKRLPMILILTASWGTTACTGVRPVVPADKPLTAEEWNAIPDDEVKYNPVTLERLKRSKPAGDTAK